MGASKPSGKSLISYLEWRAENTPKDSCFEQPNEDYSVLTRYSYEQVLQIVNNLAGWLIRTIGECEPLTAFAFFGVPDPRYVLVPLAARKANCIVSCGILNISFQVVSGVVRQLIERQALVLGLQNSLEANAHLCKETNARAVLYTEGIDTSVVPTDENLQVVCVPEIDELLGMESSTALPEVDHEHGTFLCLHSSGSTGMPKPIYIASECLSIALNRLEVDDFAGFPVLEKLFREAKHIYFGFPIYHMSGFVLGTKLALLYGIPVMYMSKDRQPGAELLAEAIDKIDIDAALCTPGVLEDLAADESKMRKLEQLKYIISGGGILPSDACTAINKITRVHVIFGSTEITDLEPVLHEKEKDEWEYLHIGTRDNSIEWREGPDSALREMVLRKDPKIAHLQGVFYNFPERDEWATGDLFSAHPSKENYWRYESRADDQISFSNSSTLNPIAIEDRLTADENIEHAMVIGDGRPFPTLVIQPTEEAFSKLGSHDEIRAKLWDIVCNSNKQARANGQIASQRHIILTDQDRPLVKTAKLTVSKKASVEQYKEEIEAVYKNATNEDHRDLSKRIDE